MHISEFKASSVYRESFRTSMNYKKKKALSQNNKGKQINK